MAKLTLPPAHRRIGEALQALFAAKGAQGYLVGGYVRNLLLGLPPADLDIASALLPEEVVQAAAAAGFPEARIVNARLGTVLLQMDGEKIEHTTFRRESYAAGGGHTPARVEIGATLLEDALRRDFAVNALYMRLTDGEVLDPTGRGLADIAARRLRSARPCAAEMIRDDALRLLRLVRFACQLDFQIESALFRAAREYAGQIHAISRERIAAEMQKILLSDTAYALPRRIPAAQRAVILLECVGVLRELIPEFAGYREIGQCKYHKYNVFLHTAHAVGETPPDLVLRYAALLHDVGKPGVWRETGRMLGHDLHGADIAARRLPEMGVDRKTTEQVVCLIREHMYDLAGQARESRIRRKIQSMGYAAFDRLILLREADFLGSGKESRPVATAERFRAVRDAMQRENAPMQVSDLDITGRDLMAAYGLRGAEIGRVLHALLDFCALHPAQNKKQHLLRLAPRFFAPGQAEGGTR